MTCATYLSCPEQVPLFLLLPSLSTQRLSFLRCIRTPRTRIWLRASHTCGPLSIRARRPSEFWSKITSINSWRLRALLTVRLMRRLSDHVRHLTCYLSIACRNARGAPVRIQRLCLKTTPRPTEAYVKKNNVVLRCALTAPHRGRGEG